MRRAVLVRLAALLVVTMVALATDRAQSVAATPPGGDKAPGGLAGKTSATWWGHAAFFITTPAGATIAVDPWLDNPKAPRDASAPSKLDAILVTHGHQDHVGQALQLAKQTGAPVVAAFELQSLIGAPKNEGGNVGGTVRIKDVTITMVEAVHSSGFGQDPKALRYGGPATGFVIAVDRGPVIYHAGDTDVFASMSLIRDRYHPTVAMLPVGGYYTMDPDGAAFAARLLGAKTVVPMHYGTFPALSGTPEQLKAAVAKQKTGTKVLVPTPGVSFVVEQ